MTNDNASSRLLTPRDASRYLGRSVAALAQLRYRGTGPRFIHAGGRVRYRQSDIDVWLQAGERDAT
ncbi:MULTISPECIES: AlpA family transcriptional regulator [unclassified Microbacterium]|uniref:helix-turn-helix transcriptional regulator n=1 Tax=unclassified Microbacterium TaxID=2609290 RepID=UPI000EAAA4C9|nr:MULTISPECIES: helix-turn-helix domain-containing protein [unclassified Microbacterium]MBT2485625.1 helix-turn-helix domain-containing protein [Microbacterium sp. ISL-108]RKN68403.1 DNA-binding protein [Microbacterium sp. CGR2]